MPQTLQIGPTDYRDQCNVNSDIVKDNATAYVAGYLIHKSQKIHSCPTCRNAIQCDDLDDNRKLFCFFKAFDQAETTFGGLHAPTNDFLDYIMKLEDVFFENFSIYTKSLTVGKDILMLLNKIPLPFKCCDEFPLEFIAAEPASLKRASEAADLICIYGENLSQTMFTPKHCGRARSEMRNKLLIGFASTTKFCKFILR